MTGDRTGQNTLPVILDLQTPLGLQGTRGIGPDVTIVYHVRDREFDPTDVEIEYGVDANRDGTIQEEEFKTATAAPGGDGVTNLNASPGTGAVHTFIWQSLADVTSGRYVTQDYVYTQAGRVKRDDFGEPIFQSFPGAVIRIRPLAAGVPGAWRYSDPFDVNNNNRPSVDVGTAVFPPEGQADGTVNEQVLVNWTAKDPDGDSLTIAVDWVSVPMGYDTGSKSADELEALPWSEATAGTIGEGTYDLPASPTGIGHQYGWSSVVDAGTVNQWILLRFRPIDGKLEVGDWFYASKPFHLDNYTIFTDPDASLPTPLAGSRAVLLRDNQVETVLITGGSATEGGDGSNQALFFYPGRTQTTKGVVAAIPGGMHEPRVGHSATRLMDGRVLIAGGGGTGGAVSDTAEIYDPASRTFTTVPAHMSTPRRDHTASLLPSGDVLIAGGHDDAGQVLGSAELFHPASSTFEPVSGSLAMGDARAGAGATTLPDGRVLIAGGTGTSGPLATVEIYDPAMKGFVVTDVANDMARARAGLSLTGTLDAKWAAVAAGGMATEPTDTIERFDWMKDDWSASAVTMRVPRVWHSAVLLGDARILLAGGQTDSGGALSPTADIYDPATDSLDLPNGDMLAAVRNSAVAILQKGRPVFFGGLIGNTATNQVQVFTPDGGFNERPIAQIADMLGALEPWSFGVRIRWRAIDAEGDPVRIVCQYRIKPSANDDSDKLPEAIRDKWLPATMRAQTVLGEMSSGLTALGSRSDFVDTVDNPIDAPDEDPGEHLFVWYTEKDIPRGDYDNVFFRIFIYGSEEGTGVESARFSIAKNAPVIARITDPLNTSGNLVVPFYLQDSDAGELARLTWQYGIDLNHDGKIVEADGESWYAATHASVSVDLGGKSYTDAGTTDLASGSKDPDPNNDYTSPTGIPWGKLHYFVWDSVYDLGCPPAPRDDVILRVTPYDYPAGSPQNESLGIEQTFGGFTIEKDPNGLYLSKWYPKVAGVDGSGTYSYSGVKLDEPLVFEFTAPVDPASLAAPDGPKAVQIFKDGGGTLVTGYFDVDNSSGKGVVTFYPQVQELPSRQDILAANTGYTVSIFSYSPGDRTHAIVKRLGADPTDTNARNLLLPMEKTHAFKTGTGVLPDSKAPSYLARVTPAASSDVATSSAITVEIDDRLLPGTVNSDGFVVVAKAFSGVESVVYGTMKLQNVVDGTGSGGSARKYSLLTLTPDSPLPAGTISIEVRLATGLRDLAGNTLASATVSAFTTAAAATTVADKYTEEFDDASQRDASLTTAFWGPEDPVDLGGAAGSGVKGKLTGLYDFGDGSDGALDFSKGDVTIDTAKQAEWNLTSLVVPEGRKLILKGSKPAILRVQGDVEIYGTVDASGQPGESPRFYDCWSSSKEQSGYGATGGEAGPGGGAGGGGGYYKWQQTTAVAGNPGKYGYGASKGDEGTAGDGALYNPNIMTIYYGPGGGGAGHVNAGKDGGQGYYSYTGTLSKGLGGSTYGKDDLSGGLEAGCGGGAGAGAVLYYPSGTYYRYGFVSGGGGGGGGGALQITAVGKIAVLGRGEILANGGEGGNTIPYSPYNPVWYYYTSGSNTYYSTYTMYPGGGGGGSGGCVRLQAGAGFDLTGRLDVSGGAGGTGRYYKYYAYTYAYYEHFGGDGGDGRLVLEGPSAPDLSKVTDLRGCVTVTESSSFSGGSGKTDWVVSSDASVDTDSGSGAPSGVFSGGNFYVGDFTIKSGATLTVKGSKPFKLYASGDVDISGDLVAKGQNGQDYSVTGAYGTSSGFLPYTYVYGGAGGPGGAPGGDNVETRTYTDPPASGMDGYGVDGKLGGKGAGTGGGPGTAFDYYPKYVYTSYTRQYHYYYYYFSGGGGGGGSAEPGQDAPIKFYYSSQKRVGVPGKGGAVTVAVAPDEDTITGGGGGGGGSNAGYRYQYQDTDTKGNVTYTYKYYYSYGTSTGGGGGGGAVVVVADGSISVTGTIDLQGGRGGDRNPTSYTYCEYNGAGGGGGGGNLVMKAKDGFDLSKALIDARGGVGGRSYYEYTSSTSYDYGTNVYSYGGAGGRGAIHLVSPKAPDILNAGNADFGESGTATSGTFHATKDGVSKWQDSGVTAPDFSSVTAAGGAIVVLRVQGAQTDPDTGGPDLSTMTDWKEAASIDGIDGRRWFRFWVELKGTKTAGTVPSVDSVTVNWTSRK